MRRRVLKHKEADRALWVTLFALVVAGVGVAMWVTANMEKKQVGRTNQLAPTEFRENPAASPLPELPPASATPIPTATPATQAPAPSGTPPTRSDAPKPVTAAPPPVPAAAHTESRGADAVVALLTTPQSPTVGAMTQACRDAIKAKGPFADAQSGRTWPECTDGAGHPMVVQFCTYARLTTGEWVLSDNNRNAPRCQAEFPLVRAGKVKPAANP